MGQQFGLHSRQPIQESWTVRTRASCTGNSIFYSGKVSFQIKLKAERYGEHRHLILLPQLSEQLKHTFTLV